MTDGDTGRQDEDLTLRYLQQLGDPQSPAWRRVPLFLKDSVQLCWEAGRSRFLVSVALGLLGAGLLTIQVLVGKHVLELALSGSDLDAAVLVRPVVVLGLVTAALRVNNEAQAHLRVSLMRRGLIHLQRPVLRVGGSVPMEVHEDSRYFERQNAAEWSMLYGTFSGGASHLTTILAGLFGLLAVAGILLSTQPLLLLTLVLAAAAQTALAAITVRETLQVAHALTETRLKLAELNGLMVGRDHAKEVHALGLHAELSQRWEMQARIRLAGEVKMKARETRRDLRSQLLCAMISALGPALLLVLFVRGDLSLPEAAAAGYALQQGRTRTTSIATATSMTYHSAAMFDAYRSFTRLGELVKERAGAAPVPTATCDITADKLSFTYPAAAGKALDQVSLTIPSGWTVAVVGENGSGKTTLAKALVGLYTPTAGSVRWNDTDAGGFPASEMHRNSAILFQDFSIFEFSALVNIGFGDVARVDDLPAARQAAGSVGIDELLTTLPQGYDTVISPRIGDGVDLSGGQRQRLALARAFFRQAPLLVLDEPASALDAKAEKQLYDEIYRVAAGRTVLFISHRFTTVRAADHIIVLRNGRLDDQGTHAELMARGGHYSELFELQARNYRTAKA